MRREAINSQQFALAAQLFLEARTSSAQRRAQVVGLAEGEDPIVARELRRLLADDSDDVGFLNEPAPWSDAVLAGSGVNLIAEAAFRSLGADEPMPARIGRYSVISRLGAGGMGVVYEARQEAPARSVAVKIIRAGLSGESALRRFRYEAEVLARLNHPGIAHIYEAGIAPISYAAGASTAEMDRPFFAMELVDGQTLTRFADERQLSLSDKLELLAKVCDAVQHAHAKGVIHRDIKPGNILVQPGPLGVPQPKVLDFGVARATDGDMQTVSLPDATRIMGTLAYMSPEQLAGDARELDTRSDVYSLGVVLYELLSGRLPHQLAGKSAAETIRMVQQDEPTRLGVLNAACRGDIETIAQAALERDAARRYQSPADLARDLRRFLTNQPISARPPTVAYQLRKFACRNRQLAAGMGLALAALVIGAAGASWQAFRATTQARRAESAETLAKEQQALAEARLAQVRSSQHDAETAVDFLTDMLTSADPDVLNRDLLVRDILDQAAPKVTERWRDQPQVEARIRDAIGRAYAALGDLQAARPQLERALELRRNLLGPDDVRTLATEFHTAVNACALGRHADAEPMLRHVAEARQAQLGAEHEDTIAVFGNLALVYDRLLRFEEAERLYSKTIADADRVLGATHEIVLNCKSNLAFMYFRTDRLDECERLYTEVLDARRGQSEETLPATIAVITGLAQVQRRRGKFAEAGKLLGEVLEARRRVLGDGHPDTIGASYDLALFCFETGDLDRADELYAEVLRRAPTVLGEQHRNTLRARYGVGTLRIKQKRYDEARQLLEATLAGQRAVFGDDHIELGDTLQALACVHSMQHDDEAAVDLYARAIAIYEKHMPADNWTVGAFRSNRGDCLIKLERYEAAEAELLEAHRVLSAAAGQAARVQEALRRLIACYDAWGKPEKAERYRGMLQQAPGAGGAAVNTMGM